MDTTSSNRAGISGGWKFGIVLLAAISTPAMAQIDTVVVPGDIMPGEGNLNRYVDSVKFAGKLSTTVFKLVRHQRYVLTDTVIVPPGEHLMITADEPGGTQETAPPQILCTSKTLGYYTTVGIMFDCYGDISLKNIWLFYANTSGQQTGPSVTIEDDPIANSNGKGEIGVFDNVIFDYAAVSSEASGAVSVKARHFKGTFRNCYWKNCVDAHLRYYGRAVSFPFMSTTWHGDSLIFENCTFANLGYVLSQEEGQYYDYVKFNHCTFVNVVMFALESGWWKNLALTNSVFVNTYMFGHLPLFGDGDIDGGTMRIDSLSLSSYGGPFAFPFTESDRRILFAGSSYWLENWLTDWISNNHATLYWWEHGDTGFIPVPQPMLNPRTMTFFDSTSGGQKIFPYMNRANLHDSTNPGFVNPPSDTAAIKSFLYRRWWDSSDTLWAWKPENSINAKWPLEENLAFTNQVLLRAGMGGYPLGDLYRWFPDKYVTWKSQVSVENARVDTWLNTGVDPGGIDGVRSPSEGAIPVTFMLGQNYPNPFNPTTQIEYSIPASGRISLKIYSLLGKEVATLYSGFRQPGNYTAGFDGSGLASGVYFYRLRSGDFVATRKLMLLK